MRRIVLFALFLSLTAGPALADNVDTLLARSKAAQSRGENDTAIRLAQAAIVADPARAASYAALGDLYARDKEGSFATYYFDEALSIDPTLPEAIKGLAQVEGAQKEAAAARSLDKQ
jgi:cytochrome c-type biogenesis protein CcmH/NrfG